VGREPLVSCRARDIMLDTEASPQTPGASAPSRRILCIGGCDPLLTARTQDRSLRRTTHDCSYRSACLTGFVGSYSSRGLACSLSRRSGQESQEHVVRAVVEAFGKRRERAGKCEPEDKHAQPSAVFWRSCQFQIICASSNRPNWLARGRSY
jgi:hypothetical protein